MDDGVDSMTAPEPTMPDGLAGELAAALRKHLPKDRYDGDEVHVGTYCSCGGWEGDYFADGDPLGWRHWLSDGRRRDSPDARRRPSVAMCAEAGLRHPTRPTPDA